MNPGSSTSPSTPENCDFRPPAIEADAVPHPALTHGLGTPVLKYLEGRGQLLGIEAQEALQQLVSVSFWLSLAAIAAFAGWLLLAASLVGILTEHFEWSWVKATGILGAAHILVALTAGFATWNRVITARWFADSLNELKKDRAWLKTQTTKN